ncbi:MAG: CHAT domain-containing protein, partial [Smithella sp.]|nr:CHAT domain-containing protein [Smithella sp.]
QALAFRDWYQLRGKEKYLEKSIQLFEKVLEKTPKNDNDRPRRLNSLAIALIDRYSLKSTEQDVDKSITLLEEALRTASEESTDRTRCLISLAVALRERYQLRGVEQDEDESLALFKRALERTPEDANDRPMYLNNLAIAMFNSYTRPGCYQNLDESIALFQQALALTPEGHTDPPPYLYNLALALLQKSRFRGNYKDLGISIALFQKALALTQKGDINRPLFLQGLAIARQNRYSLMSGKQDLENSIAFYEEALENLPDSQIDKPMYQQDLANLHLGTNNIQAALKAYEGMAASLEVQRASRQSRRGREKMLSDYSEAYARLVFCCLKLDQPEKALRYAEAAKSRALVDTLHNQVTDLSNFATDDEDLQADLNELQKVQQKINSLLNQLEAGDETVGWTDPDITRFRRPPEDVNAELSQKREKEETLWQILERKAPVFAMTVSAPPFNLQDAVNLAKQENAALISYYKHSGGWVAFVVVSDNLYIKKIEGVEELLNHYQSAFSNLHSEFARLLLNLVLEQAWSVLIEPLIPWLPGKGSSLVIAPFAGLHHLPFAAFTNPKDGSYLLDCYHLKAATSLGTLEAMHAQAEILPELKVPSRAITAVGYAGALAAPAYLKAVDNEVAAISGLFSSEPPLTGQNAIIQNVLSQAPGSQTLHFACHGIFNPEQPQLSGLLLEDGWLTVRDVMTRMNLSGTEMVVMSACLSGLSKISKGEELTGLLTAFISSRAKAVVGSLWSVDDQSTEKLMVRFYELINQGMQKHDALRQAQLEIHQQPQWSHPYYWAPFFLTGVG